MQGKAILAVLALAACNNKKPEPIPEPRPQPTPAAQSSAAPSTSSSASAPGGKLAEIAWDAPSAWQRDEKQMPMRKATYKVPHAQGDDEDAEVTVSQVGGSLEQNIKRWSGQLEDKTDSKRSERTVGTVKVTIVEMKGTYSGMSMPGGEPSKPKPHYALVGAIIDTTVPTFFKMTGPERTVTAARKDFDKMVDSIHPK